MLAALGCALAPAAQAQVTAGAHVGVVFSSTLVRDSIVEAIAATPNPAPALGLAVQTALNPRYRVGVTLGVSRSDLVSHQASGDVTLTGLTVWHPALFLAYVARPWLEVAGRAGVVIYDPANRAGNFFRDGAPVDPALGGRILVEHALGRALRAGLALEYDVHRFTTSALQAEGFTGGTVVHRIAVVVTLRHLWEQESGRAAVR